MGKCIKFKKECVCVKLPGHKCPTTGPDSQLRRTPPCIGHNVESDWFEDLVDGALDILSDLD